MTSRTGTTTSLPLTAIVINTDLDMPAGKKVITDEVVEKTPAAGVTFDSVVKVDHIAEKTGSGGLIIDSVLKVDHIAEKTGSHDVTFDNTVKVTKLKEPSAGAGIDVQGLIFPTANSVTGTTHCKSMEINTSGHLARMVVRAGVYSIRLWIPNGYEYIDETGHIVNIYVNNAGTSIYAASVGNYGTAVDFTLAVGDVIQFIDSSLARKAVIEVRNGDGYGPWR